MDELFRTLTEASTTGFYLACEGLFAYVNGALATMFGYAPEELIGRKGPVDLTSPEDRSRVIDNARRRMAGEVDAARMHVLGMHKDGSTIPVEVNSRSVTYDGKLAVMGTVVDYSERQRLEDELRANESRLEKAQELAHVGWWERDLVNDRVSGSAELARIFGLAEVVPGFSRQQWADVLHPDDRERVVALGEASYRGDAVYDSEHRIVRPDGSTRVIHSQREFTRDADGRPLRLFGIVQDVTELRATEAELRASEERVRTFVDHATEALFLIDDQYVVVDVNRETCDSLGYSREELIGPHGAEFRYPTDDPARAARHASVSAGNVATFEAYHRRKDGTIFPVEVRLRRFEYDGSKFLAAARDISERKRAEQRTLAHEAVTQVLAESAGIEEAAPRILQALCEHLGWDVGVFLRSDRETGDLRPVAIWHGPESPAPHLEAILETAKFTPGKGLTGRAWLDGAAQAMPELPDGARGVGIDAAKHDGLHSVFATPLLLGSEVLGVMTFFSRKEQRLDQQSLEVLETIGSQIGQFMERKRAENALQLVEAQIEHLTRVMTMSALASSIAHEIKQPIAATVANAGAARRWLAAETPDFNEAQRALDRIIEDGMRAGGVVDRIRDLMKPAPNNKEHVDLNDAIREIVDLTQSEAFRNDVSVHVELAPDLPPVYGDRVQLQQVVLNLTINAFEAMSRGMPPRELRIGTSVKSPAEVLVVVRDSGPGFAPGVREQLFEPFNSTKPGGLGFGLWICRSIVDAHGGRLWAGPGALRGVEFAFTLPPAQATAPPGE